MPEPPALPNVSTQERVDRANAVVGEIKTRLASSKSMVGVRVKYSPKDFEFDISRILTALFPFCVISNIRYFSPSILERNDYGNEIDNVFHVSNTDYEYIVIVEAKKQAIDVRRSDRWMATYPCIAWYLRARAFERFGYDPDGVFCRGLREGGSDDATKQ